MKRINYDEFESPSIQVVWEDSPDNFNKERVKSIVDYFSQKYHTKNVNVITKDSRLKSNSDVDTNLIDAPYLTTDRANQKNLIEMHLANKDLVRISDQIFMLDDRVEEELLNNQIESIPFKTWRINKIEFSNFLSYGENQFIDYDKLEGIIAIESNPGNFAGKSVLSCDLLLFLFFNTTTKTQKSEEVFNRFSDKNRVSVTGYITIDGDEYIISRVLERKLSKSGEWNVKTELNFSKKLPNGELLSLVGEQRRETETFIKRSIGNLDDFMSTIVTTASNLEDLITAKPTSRGVLLSRFMGLDILKKKEMIAKSLYSEFSKKMISNNFTTSSLKDLISSAKVKINEITNQIDSNKTELSSILDRINKGEEYRNGLYSQKNNDIDSQLLILNPDKINQEIENYLNEHSRVISQITSLNTIKPSVVYDELEHKSLLKKLTDLKVNQSTFAGKIREIESLINKYQDGLQCEYCSLKIIDTELTKNKIKDLDQHKIDLESINDQITSITNSIRDIESNKKILENYDRDSLIKEKLEVTIESINLKIDQCRRTLSDYDRVQTIILNNKEIETQIIKADSKINELNNRKKQIESKILEDTLVKNKFTDDIVRNQELIEKIAIEFEADLVYKTYLDLYGKNGIAKDIMKSMLPYINSELQVILHNACYFNLILRIDERNEVDFIMVNNMTGIESPVTSGSGYEKTISAMALRAILTKISSLPKPNILVMDEVFGPVSNENLELINDFFVKIKKYFEKILIISHNPIILGWANNIIQVNKINNISYANVSSLH